MLRLETFFIIFFLLFSSLCFAEEDISDELLSEIEAEYQTQGEVKEDISVNDPFHHFNRAMFLFNDKLYLHILDPVSKGYEKVTPATFREGFGNFCKNLFKPITILNSLLQLEFKNAGKHTASFLLNSTIGLFGLFDVTDDIPSLKKKKEDFGQTLGKYGVGNGFYIVLPFLGPTTLRDFGGMVFDYYATYEEYLENIDGNTTLTIGAIEQVNTMQPKIKQYKEVKKIAVDPYTAIRNAYIQKRNQDIKE